MRSMIRKSLLVLPLFLLWVARPAFPLEKITIPCEVMEVSKPFESSSGKLNGVRYMLVHHAHAEDRETLSKWLKAHSGTEVTFIVDEREYKGILFRLAHCFGRGLLIYADDIRPEKRDIIEVILSPPP
ncbi:MAG: hypothetical protein JRJ77_10105 [Deltaproteobacteria bacterium]|nr:hypothetical protein [Deltaproteobacteria bacterium]MBW2339144.1 hypothetical protein [Deltaproteobacteria bacterium]